MKKFLACFEKLATVELKTKRDAKKRADAAALGEVAGSIGAYVIQKGLGHYLKKGHELLPYPVKGPSSRDLSLIVPPDMAELGKKFMAEHQLTGLTFNWGDGPLKDYYNPIKHSVKVTTKSPAVLLHELGHAADIRASGMKLLARGLPGAAAVAAVPASLIYGESIKKKIPGSVDDKIIDAITEHPYLTTLGGYSALMLYPEAKASYSALKFLNKHKGKAGAMAALKNSLGPAFGTYMAGALPLLGAAWFAKHVAEKGKVKESKGMRKAALDLKNIPDSTRKAFWLGFTGAAIPATAGAYYTHGTRGGKAVKEIDKYLRNEKLKEMEGLLGKNYPDVVLLKTVNQIKDKNDVVSGKHPAVTSAAKGLALGTIVGLITATMMHGMDVTKKVVT